MNNRLHIGNLAADTTASTLEQTLAGNGRNVTKVQLVMSRDIGRSRGFAFAEMASDADAAAAIEAVHGATIDGNVVRVALAHPPKSRYGGTVGVRRA